jgi:hypothetical protein
MLKGVNVYVNVTWLFDEMKLNMLKKEIDVDVNVAPLFEMKLNVLKVKEINVYDLCKRQTYTLHLYMAA